MEHVIETPGPRLPVRALRRIRLTRRKAPEQKRWRRSPLARLFSGVFALINRVVPWHRLPRPLGVLNLIALRGTMREHNLHDTSKLPSRAHSAPPPLTPEQLVRRSPDGTYNDVSNPRMGCVGARFGRNIPLERAWPEAEPGLLEPSPRIVSNQLMARETFVPARSLNLMAAAWIQFMVHDWFDHGTPRKGNEFRVPLDTARGDDWHQSPMLIRRT
ncbi:peroxidase family protein, partial [Pyxidicoccus fallax]